MTCAMALIEMQQAADFDQEAPEVRTDVYRTKLLSVVLWTGTGVDAISETLSLREHQPQRNIGSEDAALTVTAEWDNHHAMICVEHVN